MIRFRCSITPGNFVFVGRSNCCAPPFDHPAYPAGGSRTEPPWTHYVYCSRTGHLKNDSGPNSWAERPTMRREARGLAVATSVLLLAACSRDLISVQYDASDDAILVAALPPHCGCLSLANTSEKSSGVTPQSSGEIEVVAFLDGTVRGRIVLGIGQEHREKFDWAGPENNARYRIVAYAPRAGDSRREPLRPISSYLRFQNVTELRCSESICAFGPLVLSAAAQPDLFRETKVTAPQDSRLQLSRGAMVLSAVGSSCCQAARTSGFFGRRRKLVMTLRDTRIEFMNSKSVPCASLRSCSSERASALPGSSATTSRAPGRSTPAIDARHAAGSGLRRALPRGTRHRTRATERAAATASA